MPTITLPKNFDYRQVSPMYQLLRRLTLRPLVQYKLYMIQPGSADSVDCSNELVEVMRFSTARSVTLEVIYNDLLSLRQREYGEGLINVLWESDLRLVSARVDAVDVAHIELTGTLVATETCSMARIKAQLEEPAKQIRSGTGAVRGTVVRIDGRVIDTALRTQ